MTLEGGKYHKDVQTLGTYVIRNLSPLTSFLLQLTYYNTDFTFIFLSYDFFYRTIYSNDYHIEQTINNILIHYECEMGITNS